MKYLQKINNPVVIFAITMIVAVVMMVYCELNRSIFGINSLYFQIISYVILLIVFDISTAKILKGSSVLIMVKNKIFKKSR